MGNDYSKLNVLRGSTIMSSTVLGAVSGMYLGQEVAKTVYPKKREYEKNASDYMVAGAAIGAVTGLLLSFNAYKNANTQYKNMIKRVSKESYEDGYSTSDAEGYNQGYREGSKTAKSIEYQKGKTEGYKKGHSVGETVGYKKGLLAMKEVIDTPKNNSEQIRKTTKESSTQTPPDSNPINIFASNSLEIAKAFSQYKIGEAFLAGKKAQYRNDKNALENIPSTKLPPQDKNLPETVPKIYKAGIELGRLESIAALIESSPNEKTHAQAQLSRRSSSDSLESLPSFS